MHLATGRPEAAESKTSLTYELSYKVKVMTQNRWAAKATELNRHTTRMKIRGSVVS